MLRVANGESVIGFVQHQTLMHGESSTLVMHPTEILTTFSEIFKINFQMYVFAFSSSVLYILQVFVFQLLSRNGFVINTEPSLTIKGTRENEIVETLRNASKQRWQLAIVILNSYDSTNVYELVKRSGNQNIGLMTQCVNYQALKRNIGNLGMCK
jgi:hypothetical protein